MDLTDAQKLTDLRQRILENERNGRPAHFGITPEELQAGLAVLRQNRIVASTRGGEASAKARKKKAGKTVDEAKMKRLFSEFDLD